MAEFQEVAKELERMCNMYHAARKCGTDDCPVYYEDLCYAQVMVHVHGDDACNLEEVVMSWAEKHPKPVYPTWVEWLREIGIVPSEQKCFHDWLLTPIPTDIAQKLGIEPKEAQDG